MSEVRCLACGQLFASNQYLQQHLDSEAHYGCTLHYFRRKKSPERPKRPPNNANSAAKRQKTIEDIERIQREMEEAERLREARGPPDYSVFDFNEEDPNQLDNETPLEATTHHNKEGDNKTNEPEPLKEGGSSEGLRKFKDYIEYATHNNTDLSPSMQAACQLMSLMNLKGGSLTLYKEVMKWHFEHLKDQEECIMPDTLHGKLIERYGMSDCMPYEINTTLHSTGETVPITVHDCEAQTADLLTDVHVKESDYLFPGNQPDGAPPEEWDVVSDLTTSLCYRETHKQLIEPMPFTKCGRRRILCAYIFYLDGCVTGQNDNGSIEILKFTLGLFNNTARRQKWAWRELGYVHQLVKGKGRAKDIVNKSDHVDSQNYAKDDDYRKHFYTQYGGDTEELQSFGQKLDKSASHGAKVAQNLHKQLHVILASYRKLEAVGGMDWDIMINGKMHYYRLVPYIPFFKVDGKEGDKLCHQYTIKTGGVKCLCRMCLCPTMQTNEAYRDDAPKTVPMIKRLVDLKKGKELQEMSQYMVDNALHHVRWGLHNDKGVHGGTPPEALHYFQLGQYKYDLQCFFNQVGTTSQLSKEIDSLCGAFGSLIHRQSDRDKPRTTFNSGVSQGKVQGHEMTGTILVLTAVLRSAKGRNTILNMAWGDAKKHFPDEKAVISWLRLLETQLELEAWLKEPEMKVELVKRADTKMREYMNMCKRVQKRDTKMEHNLLNHHYTKHIPQTILDFGTPENVNTFDNERQHKPDKKTAQRTQKQADKFDAQMGRKIQEERAVATSMVEMANGTKKWHHRRPKPLIEESGTPHFEPNLCGVKRKVARVKGTDDLKEVVHSKSKAKENLFLDMHILDYVDELMNLCSENIDHVFVYDKLKLWDEKAMNNTQQYNASPCIDGKPWYDWAVFDLSEEDQQLQNYIPCQIKCFVDLTHLPNTGREMDTVPGLYAIVEPTVPNPDLTEQFMSELWQPFLKKPSEKLNWAATKNHLELVSLNRLKGPAMLIPDLGNSDKRAYLQLTRKQHWSFLFEEWLKSPHKREYDSPDESDEDPN